MNCGERWPDYTSVAAKKRAAEAVRTDRFRSMGWCPQYLSQSKATVLQKAIHATQARAELSGTRLFPQLLLRLFCRPPHREPSTGRAETEAAGLAGGGGGGKIESYLLRTLFRPWRAATSASSLWGGRVIGVARGLLSLPAPDSYRAFPSLHLFPPSPSCRASLEP